MNTSSFLSSVFGSLTSNRLAGAPTLEPIPAKAPPSKPTSLSSNPGDCWCVAPEPAPAACDATPPARSLAKPKARGASVRFSAPKKPLLTYGDVQAPPAGPLPSPPAAPPPATPPPPATLPPIAMAKADALRVPPLRALPPSLRPATLADLGAAKGMLVAQFATHPFKDFAGEETAASAMADHMSLSAARGLRELDRQGLLDQTVANSGEDLNLRPDVLSNTVRSALTRYDLGLTQPSSAADAKESDDWLKAMLKDSRITGGKNAMTDRDATKFLAANLTPAVARGLSAKGDALNREIDRYCDRHDTIIDAATVLKRLIDALKTFSDGVSPTLEKEAMKQY